ncbi:unnamed protein product [Moneuplotes crassus]|uniref:Uncharacterized protein n=1 Tax=Euplotes crassus TaxID=5936 RepID=A0AAD1XVT1_EUPCR|nr:unnamed protein product [Moneuplotes crassus]
MDQGTQRYSFMSSQSETGNDWELVDHKESKDIDPDYKMQLKFETRKTSDLSISSRNPKLKKIEPDLEETSKTFKETYSKRGFKDRFAKKPPKFSLNYEEASERASYFTISDEKPCCFGLFEWSFFKKRRSTKRLSSFTSI